MEPKRPPIGVLSTDFGNSARSLFEAGVAGSFGSLAPRPTNRLTGLVEPPISSAKGLAAAELFGSGLAAKPANRLADLVAPSFGSGLANPSFGVGLLASSAQAARDLGLFAPPPPAGAANDLGLFAMSSLIGHNNPPTTTTLLWQHVIPRFTQFHSNLRISEVQRGHGQKAWANVTGSLNRKYYGGSTSETDNVIVIGSWGKHTQVAPPRDVDLLFLAPGAVYHRFQQRSGNKQSQLLQEVREALLVTNPNTEISADRHVVVVPFSNVKVEVAVGFRCEDNSIIVCDSKGDGKYVTSTAEAEASEINGSDLCWNKNTRPLIRYMKCWQRYRNVPLKSFLIERLAVEFMRQWEYHDKTVFYHDWMVRDFFAYLATRVNTHIVMPGTSELIWLGNEWQERARRAHQHAITACSYERDNYGYLAGEAWQNIFGTTIPLTMS